MKKINEEEIKQKILDKFPDANILSLHRERKQSKTRIIVKIKCSCGIIYDRELSHIIFGANGDLCGHCSQEAQRNQRKLHYNQKYRKMLEKNNVELLDDKKDLYADEVVKVKCKDTNFIFYWRVGRKLDRQFRTDGVNYENFRHNLLEYAKINGYTCKDIETQQGDNNIIVTCECGKKFIVNYSKFITRGQFRCKNCSNKTSKYETVFENFLKEQNISYKKEYHISSCKDIKPLPFDFLIETPRILVEIQGQQHYIPVSFGGIDDEVAKENFEKQKIRDKIKSDFCEEKNIPLIIIPYWDIESGVFKQNIMDFIQTHTE